jgi:hypothetical protein
LLPRLVKDHIQLDREFRGALEARFPVQVQPPGLRMVVRREYGPRDIQGTSEVGFADAVRTGYHREARVEPQRRGQSGFTSGYCYRAASNVRF